MPPADPYWINDLDPFLLRIHGDIGVRWYGLAYLAGILLGALLLLRWAKRDRLALRKEWMGDLCTYVGLAMIVGGRLGFCIFYDPTLLGIDGSFPFWGVLKVWEGGMASHGGIVGLAVGAWMFCRKYRLSLLPYCDAVAVGSTIGVICGRIANFINGELWGRPTDVPWAVRFPESAGSLPPEGLAKGTPDWTAWVIANTEPRHPSQLYAVFFEGLLPLIIGILVQARHRRPGLTMGVILCCYAVGRIFDECFRMPDHGKFLIDPWLTKGQALSVPVLLLGLAIAVWAWRRGPRPDAYRMPEISPPPPAGQPRA